MNQRVNKLLLTGDKFMPGMHSKQPGLTYSACEPFTKNKQDYIGYISTKMNWIKLVFNMIWQIQRLRKNNTNRQNF